MTTDAARELDIVRTATRTLRKALTADATERTRLLRTVADLLVDLRGLHTGADGLPDWRGKSFAYRDAVRDIYAGAGLSSESNDTTKTALRYHVGNALRERLSRDDLEAAGLLALDPRDRQQHRRAELGEADAVPRADRVIADLFILAKRLDASDPRGVSKADRNRLSAAHALIGGWLKKH